MEQHSDEQSQVDLKEREKDFPSSQKESDKHLDERGGEYSGGKPVKTVKEVGQKHREKSSDEDDDNKKGQSPKEKSQIGNESSEQLKQGLEESDSAGSSRGSSQRTGSLVRYLDRYTKSKLSQLLKEGLAVETEFRELAAKMGFEEEKIDILGNRPEPFVTLLDEWGTQSDSTVENLIKLLREIKRDDIAKTIESGILVQFGVAFSGGGIRSAAFCSGVLRRLIRKNKEPDYLSCVSGGGYTGSAYVQWKYKKGEPVESWADDFFNHMRKNTGHYCDWQKCTWMNNGFWDSFVLFFLLLFVAIIVPVAGWGSFACPIAFVVKFFYGEFVKGTRCKINADGTDCTERTILFSVSLLIFVILHFVEYLGDCCEKKKNYLKMKLPMTLLELGQLISGATFAFTFLPWFINDFLDHTHILIRLAIVFVSAVFWFFVPVLRKYCSLSILIYGYSYVVYWHLYKKEMFYIKYTEVRFWNGMIASLAILAVFSVLGDVPLRLVHIYNRWRLQKAFYNEDVGWFGCIKEEKCCYCYDIFPGGYCRQPGGTDEKKGLTLENLKDITPQYISNVVVNGWRRDYERKYSVLTMSPQGISVIDKQPTEAVQMQNNDQNDELKDKLKPRDIKLSSAMAMSAAAVSPYFGKYEEKQRQFMHILTVCGVEMAANIVYDMEGERSDREDYHKAFMYGINIVIFGVIATGAILIGVLKPSFLFSSLPVKISYIIAGISVALLLGLVVVIICLFVWICCSDTKQRSPCECYPAEIEKISRWCVIHLPICRFIRSMLNMITYGQTPPAMLHLSDGGHFENYGLLPLLKLRLPKILVVDGSEISSDDDYAKEIIKAMEHARELFDCSFTSMTGGDVLTDIKNNYVKKKHSRKYEFKVHYPEDGGRGVSEGHIVLIVPRRPPNQSGNDDGNPHFNVDGQPENIEMPNLPTQPGSNNASSPEPKQGDEDKEEWKHKNCEGKELNSKEWEQRPYLKEDDMKYIEGCPRGIGCCECCHTKCCEGCCKECCFVFPRHPTANQFYTPKMFTTYHTEGYRACMECDHFLGE